MGGVDVLSTLALAGAVALDGVVGEPPERLHPVAWFGSAVAVADGEWRRPDAVGGATIGLSLLAAGVVGGAVAVAGRLDPLVAAAVGAVSLFLSTSLRRLLSRARSVIVAADNDLAAAREQLRGLAGRDAASLSPGQIRSAAVESLAENLADGLVAPLAGFAAAWLVATAAGAGAVSALAVACGAAAWVKAVNTLDSMLGYQTKAVGRIPARVDDLVMWIPARSSAVLLALATASPDALGAARAWIDGVPSPNSGWPMGTLAAALDVRLEKPGVYALNPDADLPEEGEATLAIRRVAVAGLLAYLIAGVVTWA